MLKVWNVSLICATFVLALLGTFLVRCGILDSIHAFGASTIGVQFLVFIGLVVGALGGSHPDPAARPAQRGAARLAALARGLLPAQQPGAGRALPGDHVGHLLPADLRGADGHRGERRPALVQPPDHAAGAGAGAAHGDRPGAGLAAGHPGLAAPGPARAPGGRGGGAGRPAGAHRRRRQPALAGDVLLRGLRAGRGRPGVLARRRGAPDDDRRGAGRGRSRGWPGRNRRRYGGYLVHAGIAVLFLGVAASSAFIEQRDVRLSPGESFRRRRLRGDLPARHRRARRRRLPAPARRSRSAR